jgi:hypothetical protein
MTAVVLLLSGVAHLGHAQQAGPDREEGRAPQEDPDIGLFLTAASLDPEASRAAQAEIAAAWRDGYAAIFVDLLDVLRRTSFVDPRGFVQLAMLTEFLSEQTDQAFGNNPVRWRQWIWSRPYEPHPAYGEFKGRLYATLDPRFAEFFVPPVASSIRLDEVQWGGVAVNGIPPLEYPSLVAAQEADYLGDENVVFGFVNNGEAHAYPKRILAWHELALDRVGGQEITLVYCTLCGTVIPFASEVGGELRKFGTSGLLYQSNKLMFDEATRSLWSSLTGEPVVGPLVGSGLKLEPLPVVTTTWGEWRRRHPDTQVLSLDTGFQRDYSEGAAYSDYFGTDELMFDVSRNDRRLANKAEVLVLRMLDDGTGDALRDAPPYAVSADFLSTQPVYHVSVDGSELVILTTEDGANRVYASGSHRFVRLGEADTVVDSEGRRWSIQEDRLQARFDDSLSHPRVAAHRAFWFGWYAQHPDTVLIR